MKVRGGAHEADLAQPSTDRLATASAAFRLQHVGADDLLEVAPAVGDGDLAAEFHALLAGPDGLAGRAIAVEARTADRDPVPQPIACVREVTHPRDRRRRTRGLVVAAEPVGVQGGELPDELVVAVPVRRNDRRRQPEGDLQPGHPGVQVMPLAVGVLGAEEVPVDRLRRTLEEVGHAAVVVVGLVVHAHDRRPLRSRWAAARAPASASAPVRRGGRAARGSRSC